MEEWRDVRGYEGMYEVSNYGRVRSLPRGNTKGGILAERNNHGYVSVHLANHGSQAYPRVHRLVAEAFLQNPMHLPFVNHIDEDKRNNRSDNLEWCTAKYNANYGTRNERMGKTKRRAVQMYSIKGELITEFPSIRAAAEFTGTHQSSISSACAGRLNKAGGYIWKYKEV